MPTVLRLHGLRFVIWPNDHEPPHVHVFSGDGSAKIAISADGECLLRVDGLSRRQVARALAEVLAHQTHLLNEWERIHGSAD